MKKLLTREQYLDSIRTQNYTKFTDIPKTNEAFSNDVNWGDSWVGRLINSIKRKAKVAINLRRIDSLAKRLRALFDDLLETGKIVVDSSTISFLTTLTYFDELADKINNQEDVLVIISHIEIMISQIKSYNLVDGDKFIDKLNEFKESLKKLQGDETESEEEVSDSSEVDLKVEDLFKNLELLKDLLKLIQGVPSTQTPQTSGSDEIGKGAGYKEDELKNPNLVVYKNKDGQIRPGIVSKTQIAEPGNISLETPKFEASSFAKSKKDILNVVPFVKKGDKITFTYKGKKIVGTISKISKDSDVVVVKDDQGKTFNLTMRNTDFKKVESLIFEEVNPNPGDEKSKKVLEKLKGASNILTSSKDKGLAIDIKWIDQILSLRNDEKVQELVKGLYKTVYAYLLGDKRQTLNPNTSKLMEGFIDDYKLDTKYGYGVGKTQIAAEKIARFYYFCLKFTSDNPLDLSNGDIGAYKLIGNIGSKLKELNESTTLILKKEPTKEKISEDTFKVGDMVSYESEEYGLQKKEVLRIDGDKVVLKGENGEITKKSSDLKKVTESILKYKGFLKLTEAVDYDSISDKFNDIFDDKTKDAFKITEETKERLEKIVKAGDSIVITNSDPIMEIVRLFNRAWRLHTPGRIPSGRTNGKVSMSVFQEYENLGDGGGDPDNPGNGPYRNIELYEKWQEAVLSILGDTKYRTTIFSDDAKFVFVGGEEMKEAVSLTSITKGESKVDVTKSKPLGKILLRFINSLLADTQMYKKGGAMPKFIDEYFGIKGEDVDNLSFGGFNDVKNNIKTSEGIVTPKLKFSKLPDLKEFLKGESSKVGIIFRVKFEDKETFKYFRISDTDRINCYVEIFNSFPLERVQSAVRSQVPTDIKFASLNIGKQVKVNDPIQIKQCKYNLYNQKYVDGFELLTFRVKQLEILQTDEGEDFFDGDKYMNPLVSKKIKESEKEIKKLKNQVKFTS